MRDDIRPPVDRSPDDAALSRVLQSWRVDDELPPGFEGAVWSRIAAVKARSWRAFWLGLLAQLEAAWRRPAMAAAYVGLICLLGVAAGYVHGRQTASRIQTDLSRAYLQQVDPYQAPRS